MNNYTRLFVLFIFLIAGASAIAQDSLKEERIRKNTIRINLTNPAIFGDRSLILGHERTIGEHQSFSINGGLAALPNFNIISIADDSIVQLYKDSKDKGYNITGHYRFYLASENKYRAPHGLYIGPYASHVFMGRENTFHLASETFDGDVKTDYRFNMTPIGAQLG